ncbi:MAG TPA: type II toxin-antitoxin system VapC family toxin [Longimicrobiaceae bacterium]|jgi:ribonuclease VapC
MVADTSALVAVLLREPTADRLTGALDRAPLIRCSAVSLVEAAMVMQGRLGEGGERELDLLVARLRVEIVPVTVQQAEVARSAFRRFGKGRHPAGLNFGDCFSYALARALGEPLLFVGNDFSQTDVQVAPY